MKVLQMTGYELSAYILSVAEGNPMIDLDSFESQVSMEKLTWLNGFRDRTPQGRNQDDESARRAEELTPDESGLRLDRFLLAQLLGCELNTEEERGCRYLVGCVDDNGYMDVSQKETAVLLGVELSMVQRCISLMRSLEPWGVCAKNARECLKYQARRQGSELAAVIIDQHLEDLPKGHYAKIAKTLGVPLPEVRKAAALINRLEPIPGRGFGGGRTDYIMPDVMVRTVRGKLEAELVCPYSPGLKLSRYYMELLNRSDDEEVKEYLRRKLYAAQQLVSNISSREEMLLRCVREITDIQKAFFMRHSALRPMTQADLAERLGVDISTVSRIVKGKYLQCDQGMFAVRFFFTNELTDGIGRGISGAEVKAAMLELLRMENRQSPYSDQKLCELLGTRGFRISRRAVTKYREQLGIPSSYLRMNTEPEEG